jgi:L-asparaginase II
VPAEVLVDVVRSGFVEGRHRGSVVALGADGSQLWAVGDPAQPLYPRSANKPLQAVAMLRMGLDLDGELLALAAASHSGEPFHVDGARRILAGVGLDEDALQTPADWPVDEAVKLDYVRTGGRPTRIHMNCSGKHAAMLATCVANGWSTTDYRDATHPLHQGIRATVEDLAAEAVAHTGVDGCGAPVLAVTLVGLARAYRRLVLAEPGTPERRVADAVRAHPAWTSGTARDEARLMAGVPGLLGKAGAECVYAVALADGRSVALKVEDGHPRTRPVVMSAALRRLGVDAPVVDEVGRAVLLGGGQPVGQLRALL